MGRIVGAVILVMLLAFLCWLPFAMRDRREAMERCDDKLYQVALAMQGYHDVNGTLPPAAVLSAEGTPLLSWRVLILPYIEQATLFKEFRLDEPWDSDHNIRLLPKIPYHYAVPYRSSIPPFHTVTQVFVGPGTAFDGPKGLNLNSDFPDGASNTILVIEAGEPVPWTKPDDLRYDPHQPLPGLALIHRGGLHVGMADGRWRWVKEDISEAKLRAAITRNGGESLGLDFDK